MRVYKLSAGGAGLGLGVSRLQVIETGRVRQVQISMLAFGVAAGDYIGLQVGTQAVSESGISTSAPANFATVVAREVTTDGDLINVSFPVDYPVQKGMDIMLNFFWSVNTINVEQCEVYVFVS